MEAQLPKLNEVAGQVKAEPAFRPKDHGIRTFGREDAWEPRRNISRDAFVLKMDTHNPKLLRLTSNGNTQVVVVLERGDLPRRICLVKKENLGDYDKNTPGQARIGTEIFQLNLQRELTTDDEVTGFTVYVLGLGASSSTVSRLCQGQVLERYLTDTQFEGDRSRFYFARNKNGGFDFLTPRPRGVLSSIQRFFKGR